MSYGGGSGEVYIGRLLLMLLGVDGSEFEYNEDCMVLVVDRNNSYGLLYDFECW